MHTGLDRVRAARHRRRRRYLFLSPRKRRLVFTWAGIASLALALVLWLTARDPLARFRPKPLPPGVQGASPKGNGQ